jgi:hypothetical protein
VDIHPGKIYQKRHKNNAANPSGTNQQAREQAKKARSEEKHEKIIPETELGIFHTLCY